MNMKKILAAASASVLAVSAMSAVAFAAKDYTIDVGFQEGWTEFKVIDETKGDMAGQIKAAFDVDDPTTIESVTFTANDKVTSWVVGYDAAEWTQTADDELGAGDSYTCKNINWEKGDALCIKVGVSASDDDAVITVSVKLKGDAPAESTPAESTPAESTPAESKPNTDTGVEGVAAVLGVAVVAAGAMVVAKKRK